MTALQVWGRLVERRPLQAPRKAPAGGDLAADPTTPGAPGRSQPAAGPATGGRLVEPSPDLGAPAPSPTTPAGPALTWAAGTTTHRQEL